MTTDRWAMLGKIWIGLIALAIVINVVRYASAKPAGTP
jgi:hypothetical protein